jgi:hypothetical protein
MVVAKVMPPRTHVAPPCSARAPNPARCADSQDDGLSLLVEGHCDDIAAVSIVEHLPATKRPLQADLEPIGAVRPGISALRHDRDAHLGARLDHLGGEMRVARRNAHSERLCGFAVLGLDDRSRPRLSCCLTKAGRRGWEATMWTRRGGAWAVDASVVDASAALMGVTYGPGIRLSHISRT